MKFLGGGFNRTLSIYYVPVLGLRSFKITTLWMQGINVLVEFRFETEEDNKFPDIEVNPGMLCTKQLAY